MQSSIATTFQARMQFRLLSAFWKTYQYAQPAPGRPAAPSPRRRPQLSRPRAPPAQSHVAGDGGSHQHHTRDLRPAGDGWEKCGHKVML